MFGKRVLRFRRDFRLSFASFRLSRQCPILQYRSKKPPYQYLQIFRLLYFRGNASTFIIRFLYTSGWLYVSPQAIETIRKEPFDLFDYRRRGQKDNTYNEFGYWNSLGNRRGVLAAKGKICINQLSDIQIQIYRNMKAIVSILSLSYLSESNCKIYRSKCKQRVQASYYVCSLFANGNSVDD